MRRYPPLEDYGFISDCSSAALVSKTCSIDWCCMPRFDSPSVFGRLLDWDRAGYCRIWPTQEVVHVSRRYLEETLILETMLRTRHGAVRVVDCFAMGEGGRSEPDNRLLRLVEVTEGRAEVSFEVVPRFDYGAVRPWVRREEEHLYSALGSEEGLIIWSDQELQDTGEHSLECGAELQSGDRARLSIQFRAPHRLDDSSFDAPEADEFDDRLQQTLGSWRKWSSRSTYEGPYADQALRSAEVLKGLTYQPTGAIVSAPTTSLPESEGGGRNWDYRYSWVRDSFYTVRALVDLGYDEEARGFRRFVERSAAGSHEQLRILFGVDGRRGIHEIEIGELDGYRGSRPVRVGNDASTQEQLDIYGELVELAWQWHRRGHAHDDDYWRFLFGVIEDAAEHWGEADRGIWEVRGDPQHFVHSKVMCWSALDRGISLARETGRDAPFDRWSKARDDIRNAVETKGYDEERGVFVRAFGSRELDAALLRLPVVGFVAYDDERMVRTTDAIRAELGADGFLRRYSAVDGVDGEEGAFLACSFWLVECLAAQRRLDEARDVFERTAAVANDLGLFAEQYDDDAGEMRGNFPQGLTHLSHISAVLALGGSGDRSV